MEDGAGDSARFANNMYTSSGAKIVDRSTALASDIVLKVRPPSLEEVSSLKRGRSSAKKLDHNTHTQPCIRAVAVLEFSLVAHEFESRYIYARACGREHACLLPLSGGE